MNPIYIIPGFGENCNLLRYKALAKILRKKGYKVIAVNPDWRKPLSESVFPIEKDAVVFGFSFGAVIAYLIAEKYLCKKVILASISPIHTFSFKGLVKDICMYMDKEKAVAFSKDLKSIKISLKSLKTPFVTLGGEREKILLNESIPDFIVPRSGHFVTKNYIKCIEKLL
jgi:alpha/beta superfamily hydrolase